MKQTMLAIIMLSVLVLVGCASIVPNTPDVNVAQPDQNVIQPQLSDCDILKQKLDTAPVIPSFVHCDANKSYMMGGTLLNINKQYSEAYDRYEYTLIFQGKNNQTKLFVNAKNESDFNSYYELQIGKFYEFDLLGGCALRFSAASSGAFNGKFTEKDC